MRKNLQEARKKAGLTQQAMAEKLGITLVYYQKIEAGERGGDYYIWDTLEDITGIHQRKLRETIEKNPGNKEDQGALGKNQQCESIYPETETFPLARISDKH